MSVQTGGGGEGDIRFPPKTLLFFFFHRMTVDGSTVLLIILVRFTIEQFHFFIYIRFH